MHTQALIVVADIPAGVDPTEFAAHLADAHRAAVRAYHRLDPMAAAGEVVVRETVSILPNRPLRSTSDQRKPYGSRYGWRWWLPRNPDKSGA